MDADHGRGRVDDATDHGHGGPARQRLWHGPARCCSERRRRRRREPAENRRVAYWPGQSGMVWGHASIRDPQGRGIWMKAAGWSFGEVTPARVLLATPDGEVLAGNGPRHIEYAIHTEVMNARPDVGSVVHTHAPAAVSFAALDTPLLAISHDGVEFAEPQIARFTLTGSLISSAELGRELASV